MKQVPDSLRRPAKTKGEARERYRFFIQRAIACVNTSVYIAVGPAPRGPQDGVSLVPTDDPISLTVASGSPIYLSFDHSGVVAKDPRYRGEFKVNTRAYHYAIRHPSPDSEPLIMWHWHPGASPEHPEPHIHVKNLGDPMEKGKRLHIPTGSRVTIEQVLAFIIQEWNVEASEDWVQTLEDTQRRFDLYQLQDRRRH